MVRNLNVQKGANRLVSKYTREPCSGAFVTIFSIEHVLSEFITFGFPP